MNIAYIFTFFLFVLLVLFILLPFFRQSTAESDAPEQPLLPENTPLRDDEFGADNPREQIVATDDQIAAEIEAEVAVARARLRKSTFWKCSQCGRQMKQNDRFCASCGAANQS